MRAIARKTSQTSVFVLDLIIGMIMMAAAVVVPLRDYFILTVRCLKI